MSLVLQRVARAQSGIYTCVAHNSEGDGVSNPITLNVRQTLISFLLHLTVVKLLSHFESRTLNKLKPIIHLTSLLTSSSTTEAVGAAELRVPRRFVPRCSPDQVMVYGVARYETVTVTCNVLSNPAGGLRYHWVFNTTGETVQMDRTAVKVDGSRSVVEYTPRTELDYGNLLCWGENSIGVQRQPCTFHIIPAGPPDSLSNCSVHNQTFTSLQVSCGSGFDGGLKQLFRLEVRDAVTGLSLLNMSQAS